MTSIRLSAVGLILAVLLACGQAAAAGESWRSTLDDALRASGVDLADERGAWARRFERIASDVRSEVPMRRSDYRRARRIHELIHERYLARYRADADGLTGLLESGDYNCVSATLFEGLVLETLGFDASVVAGPRHVFLRLGIDDRAIDVEATSPRGFDVRQDPERVARFLLAYKLATREEIERDGVEAVYDRYRGVAPPVDLRRAVAFLWHNAGERLLDRGETIRSARAFLEAGRLHPELARRSETMPTALGRAFRSDYEAGRFERAFEVASIDYSLFPERTSAKERLLAAAMQRIEAAAEAGDPAAGEAVLNEVTAIASPLAKRLEREACPPIAASAVREGDWARAQRMVARFAAAEPDPVEGARLRVWVENRRRAWSEHPSVGGDSAGDRDLLDAR